MARSGGRINPKLWILKYLRDLRPSITHPFLRNMVRLPLIPPGLKIHLAREQGDLEQAYRLLHRVYVDMGFMETHPSGLRLNVYNMLPHTATVVAKIGDEVVGTISVIRENPLGLPLDESIDTSFYRKPGWQVAEVTGLAVSAEWRGGGEILFPLLKYIYQYAADYLKVNVFQIATAIEKEDFFRALLFFEPISDTVMRDPLINGTLVVPLYLDLNHAKVQFRRTYGQRGPHADLFSYFTTLDLPNFSFPERHLNQALDPFLTPELFKYFFRDRTDLVDRLSDRELHVLRSIYRNSPLSPFFPTPNSLPPYPARRTAQRFAVNCPAWLENSEGDELVQLMDVSETGFRLFSKLPMRLSGHCGFRIQVSPTQSIPITAVPIWNRRRREWGFQLVEIPLGWREFLAHLENQIKQVA